jgi:hypothetical protein
MACARSCDIHSGEEWPGDGRLGDWKFHRRTMDDILKVQDDTAGEVTKALRASI